MDTCHHERPGYRWQLSSWCRKELLAHSASFWLQILACYFSDPELLTWKSGEVGSADHTSDLTAVERGQLLGVLASRGHTKLFDQYLRIAPKETDLGFALRGACLSGSMTIASLVLSTVPAEQHAALCLNTLKRIEGFRRLPLGYSAVAEKLLDRCGDIGTKTLIKMLAVQADLGAVKIVRLLLTRYPRRELYPMERCTLYKHTPIWSACINRDVQLLRDIVDLGYFAGTSESRWIQEVYKECEEVAARVNSLEILQQLCHYQNKELHDVPLRILAAIDGSIPSMIKRLETILNLPRADRSVDETSPALGHAIERFHVENARFLLERGTQLDVKKDYPKRIEWRFRRAHEQRFQEMRALLQEYSLAHLLVVHLI